MLRSNSEQSVKSIHKVNPEEGKGKAKVGRICRKGRI